MTASIDSGPPKPSSRKAANKVSTHRRDQRRSRTMSPGMPGRPLGRVIFRSPSARPGHWDDPLRAWPTLARDDWLHRDGGTVLTGAAHDGLDPTARTPRAEHGEHQ